MKPDLICLWESGGSRSSMTCNESREEQEIRGEGIGSVDFFGLGTSLPAIIFCFPFSVLLYFVDNELLLICVLDCVSQHPVEENTVDE